MAAMALLPSPAAAHNWMMTPSRSYKKAATTNPCILRKATDTHQQVGPNQSFVMKFAAGHAGDTGAQCIHPIKDVSDPKCIPIGKEYTSIVLIRAEDYHWLSHADYALFVEEYITHAPASDHLDPKWSRYHGIPDTSCGNCDGLGEDRGGIGGFMDFASMTSPPEPPGGSHFHMPGRDVFAFNASEVASAPADSDHVPLLDETTTPAQQQLYLQRLKKTSQYFPDHTFAPSENVFRLTKKALKNDRRSTYYNAKYPWIITAGIYPHLFQRPSDYSAVRVTIPATHGSDVIKPGHYIAHYRWKGYSDCTDVNLHDTNMTNVDGVDNDKYVWNKIDHCQYEAPKEIMTRCHIASASPDQCVRELTGMRHESECKKNCNNRYGVNVVPLVNPKQVMFKDRVNIPWRNGTCANSDWTRLRGTVTTSEVLNWTKWDMREVPGKYCSNILSNTLVTNRKSDLRNAVLYCGAQGRLCSGVSVNTKLMAATGGSLYDGKTRVFMVCKPGSAPAYNASAPTRLLDDGDWVTLLKTDAEMEDVINPATPPEGEYVGVVFGPTHTTKTESGGKLSYTHVPLNLTGFPATGMWFHQHGAVFGATTAHTAPQGMPAPFWLRGASGATAHMGWDCAWDHSEGSRAMTNAARSDGYVTGVNWYGGEVSALQLCNKRGDPLTCINFEDDVIAANTTLTVDYEDIFVRDIHNAKCGVKHDVQNEWGIAVTDGLYRVVVGTGRGVATIHTTPQKMYRFPAYWNRGCTVENTRFVSSNQDMGPTEYTIDVEVTDGKLTYKGTSSGGRLLQCQATKYLKITRIGDAMKGPWAPIAGNTKGAWWQMELAELTPVGLVSVTPVTVSTFYEDIPRIADENVKYLDCRNWWLYKGRGCPDGGVAGPAQNPLGRFNNGGTETGVVVSISNQSCAGEICDQAGQHMCGSDEGTPGKSSFDRPAFSRVMSNGMFPQFNWCDGVAGKYVRVWLPGKDRLFDANVMVNRVQPVSPRKLARDNQEQECAVKTAFHSPEDATAKGGYDFTGTQKVRNSNCNGLKNLNADGSCCEPTSTGVSNAVKRGVVCCADSNPFTPTCAAGSTGNLAPGSLAMYAFKSGGSEAWKGPNYLSNQALADRFNLTGAEAWAQSTRFVCDPQCAILVDLGQVYDVSSVAFVATGSWDATTSTWGSDCLIAKHDVYALALNGTDLAAGPSTAAVTDMLVGNASVTAGSWRRIAGHTGDTHSMAHVLGSPARTRYIKLHITDNGAPNHRYVALRTLTITGCDPNSGKTLVPHLRGEADPGYGYGYRSLASFADPVDYPFAQYGWWQPSYVPGRSTQRHQCTTSWGMTSLGGCNSYGYGDAKDMCAGVGGRLCSIEEVSNGCAAHFHFGDACTRKYDVWTSSTCSKETTGICKIDADGASDEEDDTVVCYGVEAQVHADSSTPEYIITDDAEDPIFYSTCYVRERSVGFKPLGGETLAKGDFSGDGNETTVYNSNVDGSGKTWKVNGACMACASYTKNLGGTADDSQAPPRWTVNGEDDCRSCDATTDLLMGACNATAGIDKAKGTPCFTESSSVCSAETAVPDISTCTKAIEVARLGAVTMITVEAVAEDSALHPAGCSVRDDNGVLSGYFNAPTGNATPTGNLGNNITGCAGVVADTLEGMYTTALGTSIAATILTKEAAVLLTLRGPADGWFAFGLGAKRMGDFPHTLVVQSAMQNVKVSEWRLGSHARGLQLGEEAFAALGEGAMHWLDGGCTNATQAGGVAVGKWGAAVQAIGHVQCCADSKGGVADICTRGKPGTVVDKSGCGAGYDHATPPCAHDGVNAYMKKTTADQCDGPGEFELTYGQCAKAAAVIDTIRMRLVSPISTNNPLGGREYGDTLPQGCMHIISKNTVDPAVRDRSVRWNRNGVNGTASR